MEAKKLKPVSAVMAYYYLLLQTIGYNCKLVSKTGMNNQC
jgi:hypothetical protein